MSMGQGIGGTIGAILGVALALTFPALGIGWFAAMSVGFTIGSAIGSFIDPLTPDVDGLGKPQSKVDITTCDEGLPIPDVYGTTKLTGNVIWYGNSRSEEQTSSSGGKGGGGTSTVTGYEYYLSWAMALCEGPVDEIYSIFLDSDTAMWSGNLVRPSSGSLNIVVKRPLAGAEIVNISSCGITLLLSFGTSEAPSDYLTSISLNTVDIWTWSGSRPGDGEDTVSITDCGDLTLFFEDFGQPVDYVTSIYFGGEVIWLVDSRSTQGGVEEISIENFGTIRVYFGTADQPVEPAMSAYLSDPTLAPAYRNICYLYFDDCYIGTYNRAPMIHVVLRKHPPCLSAGVAVRNYDYNFAYMIYHILTKHMNISQSYLDQASFLSAAVTLGDEGEDFGGSLLLDRYQSAMAYLESILNHIDGIIYFDADNKFHLKLLRADSEVASLPTITTDMMIDLPVVNRKAWLDTTNEVKIQFPLRQWTDGTVVDPDAPALSIDGPETFSCPGELQYTANGGVPPYEWSILTGDATVDGNGLVTVNSCGDFTVQVADQEGATASM